MRSLLHIFELVHKIVRYSSMIFDIIPFERSESKSYEMEITHPYIPTSFYSSYCL